jgi:DNA-binding MarR family transcriptional regulator
MEEQTISEFNFDTWLLMAKLNHRMFVLRQRELNEHNISSRQLYLLRSIKTLGVKATLSEISKEVDRKLDVISGQTAIMEKNGLVQRTRARARSRLLRIELTEKGLDILKIIYDSKSMNEVLSVLTDEETQQLHSVLNRLLIKLEDYSPE